MPLIPKRKIFVILERAELLAQAEDADAALAQLFLLHCACKDCLEYVPQKVEVMEVDEGEGQEAGGCDQTEIT